LKVIKAIIIILSKSQWHYVLERGQRGGVVVPCVA